MLRLKATKTSLYKLIRYYVALPPMGKTVFTKSPRWPVYCLTWTDWRCRDYEARLAACGGKPLLTITKYEFTGEELSREVHELDLAGLRERGMVEEFFKPAARRHCLAEEGEERK